LILCLELTIFSCKHLFNAHTISVAIVSIADLRAVTSDIASLPSCASLQSPHCLKSFLLQFPSPGGIP
jgi:hypothetical protein